MKRRLLYAPLLLLILLSGCAYKITITPKQLAVIAMNTYSDQYDAWLRAVLRPEIPYAEREALIANPGSIKQTHVRDKFSEAELKMLKEKRKILKKAEPVIKQYDTFIAMKATPPAETAVMILELIDMLLQTQVEKGGTETWTLSPAQ